MASWKYSFTIQFTNPRLSDVEGLIEIRNRKATIAILGNEYSKLFNSCSPLYVTYMFIL